MKRLRRWTIMALCHCTILYQINNFIAYIYFRIQYYFHEGSS